MGNVFSHKYFFKCKCGEQAVMRRVNEKSIQDFSWPIALEEFQKMMDIPELKPYYKSSRFHQDPPLYTIANTYAICTGCFEIDKLIFMKKYVFLDDCTYEYEVDGVYEYQK
jgi:hypothetical protein